METKMSSRDKLLLIVLAIILLIFAAVMIPTYGIKDLIVNMNETREKIAAQTADNEEMETTLAKQGIPAAYADNVAQAKKKINEKILRTKYAAVKMQQNSLSTKAYAVANQWLEPVKYLHFDTSNTAATTLYASVVITNNENGFENAELSVDDSVYAVQKYTCTFACVTDDNARYEFSLDYLDDDASVDDVAILVAAYNVLSERGSITVNTWEFADGAISLGLVLTIPQDSLIEQYAGEIGECHNCGTPYYLSDYQKRLADLPEGETEVKCNNSACDSGDGTPATLTGEAIY